MPLYDFTCSKCDEVFEVSCKICEKADVHKCPACKSTKTYSVMLTAPKLGGAFLLGVNPDQRGFKEVLNKIHKKTPGSNLNNTTEL